MASVCNEVGGRVALEEEQGRQGGMVHLGGGLGGDGGRGAAGGGGQVQPLGIGAVEDVHRQALQHGDAFAQGGLEVQLAAHGALGDLGDLVLHPGEIGQFVDALAADDGGVHVGDQQA